VLFKALFRLNTRPNLRGVGEGRDKLHLKGIFLLRVKRRQALA